MPIANSPRIHPSAIIDPCAELADDVQVGANVVIDGPVKIGAGCVIRPGVHLFGPLTMGCNNTVHSHAVLGEQAQHHNYKGEATSVEIGNDNIFREFVTVHRATTESWVTRIGNHNFFMANAHVAHDCQVGNHCLMANGSMLGGHAILADNVYLSGNSAVHQFVRVGRLALLGGLAGSSKDVPPFIIQQHINVVQGINVIGMRRAGIPSPRIDAVRKAFHIIFRLDNLISVALSQVERDLGHVPEVDEMIQFIRASKRGINTMPHRYAVAA
jgi:UDP-N-acetylglucosamine acyltransferase